MSDAGPDEGLSGRSAPRRASRLHACAIAAAAVFAAAAAGAAFAQDRPYDPLAVAARRAETIDDIVHDAGRGRDIPVRVYLPAGHAAAPVVLFSHGLGGSRAANPYLGEHWSARGYAVVFMQHVGSDDAVWKDVPVLSRMGAMKRAANLQNTLLRLQDVPAVIDQLERWNRPGASPLAGRLDLARIGMSGHSFGAVTTLGVSGQTTPRGDSRFTDRRIKAALAMSPNSPRAGGDPARMFGTVAIPWLLMTGTNDVSPIGDADVASRLAVFAALPAGDKYQLVLDGAEHDAFNQDALPGSRLPRNPNHHRAILAIGTAFWDAFLRGDAAARAWLDGGGPRSVLQPADRWERK